MSVTTDLTYFTNGVGQMLGLAQGGAAGELTVVGGIKSGDKLLQVFAVEFDGTGDIAGVSDLTSEFSISADDKIDNTSGTATTDKLVMAYFAMQPR